VVAVFVKPQLDSLRRVDEQIPGHRSADGVTDRGDNIIDVREETGHKGGSCRWVRDTISASNSSRPPVTASRTSSETHADASIGSVRTVLLSPKSTETGRRCPSGQVAAARTTGSTPEVVEGRQPSLDAKIHQHAECGNRLKRHRAGAIRSDRALCTARSPLPS
jgi:hypothetical protein